MTKTVSNSDNLFVSRNEHTISKFVSIEYKLSFLPVYRCLCDFTIIMSVLRPCTPVYRHQYKKDTLQTLKGHLNLT